MPDHSDADLIQMLLKFVGGQLVPSRCRPRKAAGMLAFGSGDIVIKQVDRHAWEPKNGVWNWMQSEGSRFQLRRAFIGSRMLSDSFSPG